ncbi:Centromere protein Scm3, N-terminal [Penicillium ucsense]|uniref:Centromere protein Scm3, N-terminal n=1 Tax=Penicillium ucsense TaxID=2839758 RepID=A0A8J8VYZ0_9EURO|nr:Centromere protein Scm3, N-terminal [Penicillium ucsense]KAF7730018.1 Centromere protein Scm3, N-terminal [Penicillium ucsense]
MAEDTVIHNHGHPGDHRERPRKRQRVSSIPKSPQTSEIPQQWDLQAARAQNDLRLKSIFEGIFAKYGNDFSDVGDEIDLETGEIVVNRGHLKSMLEETDVGKRLDPWTEDPFGSDDDDSVRDEEPPSLGHHEDEVPRAESLDVCPVGDTTGSLRDSVKPLSNRGRERIASSPPGPGDKASTDWQSPGPLAHLVDPLWQAPELPPLFATPNANRQPVAPSPQLPTILREPSPPGSGSLWTVPRRRLPRSEQKFRSTTASSPSKSRPYAKRKYQSSPATRDWSFAEVNAGDESDDPLQEQWPSSPLPIPSQTTTASRQETRSSASTTPIRKAALTSPDGTRSVDSRRQSSSRANQSVQKTSAMDRDYHDRDQHHSESMPPSRTTAAVDIGLSEHDLISSASPSPAGAAQGWPSSSPIKASIKFTPDEAKLIVRMRYVHEQPWQDIAAALPGHTLSEIYQWNQIHWSDRRSCSDESPSFWSLAEADTLNTLAQESGLSWGAIMIELPNRPQSDIESELFRRWVGDEIWLSKQESGESTVPLQPSSSASVRYETESKTVRIEVGDSDDEESQSPSIVGETGLSDRDIPTTPRVRAPSRPSTPSLVETHRRHFEDFLDSDDDVVNDLDDVMLLSGAFSPSKLSSIFLDSPAPTRSLSRSPRKSPTKFRGFL